MAPRNKKSNTKKRNSQKKKTERSFPVNLPDDVVENIFSFLPVQEAVQNGLVSTRFKNSWRLSRILDFGPQFGGDYAQLDFVLIINKVFNDHIGSKIQSFILEIDPSGIMYFIDKWLQISIEKDVQELELDLIKGDKIINLPVNLSTVQTLRILRLRSCVFRMSRTPNGLRFLNTLVLHRTSVSSYTMDSVFRNCVHLETLELISCPMLRELTVRAGLLKNFKTLLIARCSSLSWIVMDAPSLEEFHYSGEVCIFRFADVRNLTDLTLDYVKFGDRVRSRLLVVPLLIDLSHVLVLSATSVLLEGLSKRNIEAELKEIDCKLRLEELQIFMESPSNVNLFDIARFLKNCPYLQRFYMDLNDFTFKSRTHREANQKQLMEEITSYKMDKLEFVEIKGFKGHQHEVEIVRFFLQQTTCLQNLALVTPRKNRTRTNYPIDNDTITGLRKLSPTVSIRVFEDYRYISAIPPRHVKKWF